ncbi:TIGR01841 family phasin [Glaciimonas sp. CA11.2]|uniref:TIGR01841 family phasin n=1 Tax=unclassified Glaciimonas TaxID=2644401 RepID=UPI002AB4C244|nr:MULTISPECIES: TIGR01841 family phasin [unclassified Glaciimonas]MDY7546361.1 TIGR01841 family phasin [Glaciimonas sp. CA11.2]MEB0010690.1 TIGR01841 family phasin [Glaciimonas sp. Cout2]MEB0082174.1 TIGR01841 family phasin [Glaciimonas sp. Gout2]MEB0163119.1 TIGR01841 family phasin [Glaciimonas sp. CA11.2]
MFSFQEQFSAATKAHFEAQLALLNTLTTKAFEGVEKVIELNMNATKASMEESSVSAKQLLGAKDAQEFMSISASQAKPSAEKAAAYGRHLQGIATGTQNELTKAAEVQIAETSRRINALIDEVSKNAPAGSENAIAILKSVIGNANAGYEQLTKSAKQAVETLEANVNNATTQFAQTAEKAARAATPKK